MRHRFMTAVCGAGFWLSCGWIAHGQVAPLPAGTSTPVAQGEAEMTANPLNGIEMDIAAKQYAKATSLLDSYLSTHPTDARALFDRGYCEDAQGRDAQAVVYYRKAIAADPKEFEPRLALGLILAREGNPGARAQLEAATKLTPDPPNPSVKAQAWRALARLVRNSDPTEAKNALLAALKISPTTPADTLLAAQIAEAAGNLSVAEQAYRKVLAEEPQSSDATFGLVHVLVAEKRYADAEPLLKAALARDPDNPALNAQDATLLAKEGKPNEAVEALERLHRLKPSDLAVTRMLADGYAQAGDLRQADAAYAALLKQKPNDPELESARGQVLIREAKYNEALELLQNAVKTKQDAPDAWAGIAFAASKTGQYDLELQALAMRSKYAPENPVTYFLRATAYDHLHRKEQAVEYYRLFLQSASGKFPDEAWQARQRIALLSKR